MSSTRIGWHVDAPRASVYRALLDPLAIPKWRVPAGMTSHVHAFDAREGGTFRVSLTYAEPTGTGKTTAHTDTYHGRFVKLIPNRQVVEVIEFETDDPALRGEMTITTLLDDASGPNGAGSGTAIHAVHDGLPPGVLPADNEAGWRDSLAKLAALVEASERGADERSVRDARKRLPDAQAAGEAAPIEDGKIHGVGSDASVLCGGAAVQE